MTHEDHLARVKKLTRSAINDQFSESLKSLAGGAGHICTCPTCGVANARLRGALAARGWGHAATHHVRVEGYDFRGAADGGYLAAIKVDTEEVHRAYDDLTELLEDEALDKTEAVLRKRLC